MPDTIARIPAARSGITHNLETDLLHILQHSLGLDQYGEGRRYRNHFVTDSTSDDGRKCEQLCALGYMTAHGSLGELSGGMNTYSLTPAGIDAVALQSPAPPRLTHSQQRYRSFLRSDCGETFGEWLKLSHT